LVRAALDLKAALRLAPDSKIASQGVMRLTITMHSLEAAMKTAGESHKKAKRRSIPKEP
jgi:hypothetical protein